MKNAKKANEFNSEYRNLLMKYDIDQTEAMVLVAADFMLNVDCGMLTVVNRISVKNGRCRQTVVLDTEDRHSEAQFGFSITGEDEAKK